MKIGKTLYVSDRKAWRAWLAENYDREKEIWLVYPKKHTGKPRILYNDAVEEALCFGWIDSIVKRIDGEKFAQRFSPRRPTSQLSQMNKERIRRMISEKRMTKAGLAAVSHAFKADSHDEPFAFPDEILNAIRKDRDAWENFRKLPESYKRIRIAYIESRRRHGAGMFKKSLQHFIKMTAKNKRFGFVKE
ncbi:MAG: YdeI/OmpD-associated family protein [Candidatus Micrarchaeota archaeon]|nr:YdeI/OmpD-associated family protein [Candidatus Micrarchaeota archaeon]